MLPANPSRKGKQMPYNAYIRITDQNHHIYWSKTVKNVGSMSNAIRHAGTLAKSHNLIPVQKQWKRKSTKYALDSGRYGSFDYHAIRVYRNEDGQKFNVSIDRS